MFNGFIPNFTNRSEESELMDGSAFKSDELVENLADLRRNFIEIKHDKLDLNFSTTRPFDDPSRDICRAGSDIK